MSGSQVKRTASRRDHRSRARCSHGQVTGAVAAILPAILLAAALLSGCERFKSVDERLASARQALSAGEFSLASIELRKAARRAPERADIHVELARVALAMGDPHAARLEIENAIAAGASGADVQHLRAEIGITGGDAQSVVDGLEKGTIVLPEPQRSLMAGRAYNALNQPDRAIEAFQRVPPESAEAREAKLGLAEAHMLRGELDTALTTLEGLIEADARWAAPHALKGRMLLARGQYAQAESELRTALRLTPKSAGPVEVGSLLAEIVGVALNQGNIDGAEKAQDELAHLLPDAGTTRYLAARLSLAKGEYREAITNLQQLVLAAPGFLQARMLLGSAHLQQGNLLQAEAQFNAIVQQAPDNLEARKLLARVRLQLHQPEAALKALSPAVEDETADPQLYALLAAVRQSAGDQPAAIEALERGVRANPQSVVAKLALAEAYLSARRPQDAIALLQPIQGGGEAIRRDVLMIAAIQLAHGQRAARAAVEDLLARRPKDVPTLNVAAAFFSATGGLERARSLLHDALAIDERDTRTLVSLADLDVKSGDLASAERWLTKALSIDPKEDGVRLALADLQARRGAHAEAIRTLESAAHSSSSSRLQLGIGQLYLASGDLAHATQALDRAVALAPNRASLWNRAGLILMQGQQFEAALARFRKASELAADEPLYLLNMGRAQLAIDQSGAARESFQKALALRPGWVPAIGALVLMDVRAKHIDAALRRLDALSAQRTDDVAIDVLRGDVLNAAGRYADAADSYEKAARVRLDASLAVKEYRARSAAGLPEAVEPLLRWLSLRPSDHRVRLVLAQHYLHSGSLKESAKEFEAILHAQPGNAVALNNAAWVYDQLGDARAIAYAERAHEQAPESAAIADTLGWILARHRTFDRAAALLEQASAAEPRNPSILYHYAYVLGQTGERARAIEVLEQALAAGAPFAERAEAQKLLKSLRE